MICVDKDGRWFGIDDLIVSSVSFVIGYVSNGITTGNWGGDALAAGGIAAGSAWLAYNTGGVAASLLFNEGRAGFAMTASTVGGIVGSPTGSIAGQLTFQGSIDWNRVGRSALSGMVGGLAGGVSGQYLTSDPILTSMIGGTISGGIEGSFYGNWLQGAMSGAYIGGWSSSLTTLAYQKYGEYLTNKIA